MPRSSSSFARCAPATACPRAQLRGTLPRSAPQVQGAADDHQAGVADTAVEQRDGNRDLATEAPDQADASGQQEQTDEARLYESQPGRRHRNRGQERPGQTDENRYRGMDLAHA